MPRITEHGGVSNRYDTNFSDEEYEHLKRRSDLNDADKERLRAYEEAGYGQPEKSDDTDKGGEDESVGTSSPASSDKTVKSDANESKGRQSTAPTTATPSKKDQAGSSTAHSTGGSGKANQ